MTLSINLKNISLTVVADSSGSMEGERWDESREITLSLAKQLAAYDDDGLVKFITFGPRATDHGEILPAQIKEIYKTLEPCGGTPMLQSLQIAFEYIKPRLSGNEAAHNLVVITTDGAPNDGEQGKMAIVNYLVEQINALLNKQGPLALVFARIGNDSGAKSFLDILDTKLKKACKIDIISTLEASAIDQMDMDIFVQKAFEGKLGD
jgi:hypothetical protein